MSKTPYTPTISEMRDAWWRDQCPAGDLDFDDIYNEAFDRGMAAHDAAVLERAAEAYPVITRDMVSRGSVQVWLRDRAAEVRARHGIFEQKDPWTLRFYDRFLGWLNR